MITETWNSEAVYASEIQPLLDQIVAICEREKIPMVAAFTLWADVEEHFNRVRESRHDGRRVAEFEELTNMLLE